MINNNVNNYYFLRPFGQEEIDKLTTKEKLEIFSADENPIVKIIVKTNLNPKTTEYHNVGYTDLKSGHGYIFDGDAWIKKEILPIMNELFDSKRNDIKKIIDEFGVVLPEEQKKKFENKLMEIQDCIEPKLEIHVKKKKKLFTFMKTRLYNNRHLVKESIKNSGKPIMGEKIYNEHENTLGLDPDELDRLLKIHKEKLELKKTIAKYMLDQIEQISNTKYDTLIKLINQTKDVDAINIIVRSLNKAMCFGDDISEKIIENQIKMEADIKEILSFPR